jgi:hypothetical protein
MCAKLQAVLYLCKLFCAFQQLGNSNHRPKSLWAQAMHCGTSDAYAAVRPCLDAISGGLYILAK